MKHLKQSITNRAPDDSRVLALQMTATDPDVCAEAIERLPQLTQPPAALTSVVASPVGPGDPLPEDTP